MATYKNNPWESYNKEKRLAIMHASMLTSACDAYLYSTKYFEFGGITDGTESIHYFYKSPYTVNGKTKPAVEGDYKCKRYVFYEIPESRYSSSNEHHYKMEGPFAHLGIANYSPTDNDFKYNGKLTDPNTSNSGGTINGETINKDSNGYLTSISNSLGHPEKCFSGINNYTYVGTTSVPKFLNYTKSTVRNLLNIVNKVGDNAGRDLLFNANWGRVRPLGNIKYFDGIRCRQTNNNYNLGDPWNGFSINTLKSRYAETVWEFVEWIGSDELHNDGPTSYPSGHSSQYWAMAMCIAQLYGRQDLKDISGNDIPSNGTNLSNVRKAVHNAYKIGVGRTIERFHWNSDTLYGKLFGSMVMPILNASYDTDSNTNTQVKYFNEEFNTSSDELFTNHNYRITNNDSGKSKVRQIQGISSENRTMIDRYNDFTKLLNKFHEEISLGEKIKNMINDTTDINYDNLTSKVSIIDKINDTTYNNGNDKSECYLYRYLWDMYLIGREEIDTSGNISPVFKFFETNEYDEEESWFPEFFDTYCGNGYKINNKTYKYHGNNKEYRKGTTKLKSIIDNSKDLQPHEILCSWLIGLCLSELRISKRTKLNNILVNSYANINNQTKIMALAYKIGGGRELNVYDEYAIDHDPMYLRFAAGIIYAYNRGKYGYDFIHYLRSIFSGQTIILDINENTDEGNFSGTTNNILPNEANAALKTKADRQDTASTIRNDGYISSDKNEWGIDTYYIFPNAPGPYINGRKLSKPYEVNQAKPGTDYFENQCQDKSLFYTGSINSGSNNSENNGNSSNGSYDEGYISELIIQNETNINFSGSNLQLSKYLVFYIQFEGKSHIGTDVCLISNSGPNDIPIKTDSSGKISNDTSNIRNRLSWTLGPNETVTLNNVYFRTNAPSSPKDKILTGPIQNYSKTSGIYTNTHKIYAGSNGFNNLRDVELPGQTNDLNIIIERIDKTGNDNQILVNNGKYKVRIMHKPSDVTQYIYKNYMK